MRLSSDLISEFVKVTKDESISKESVVYGTTIISNGKAYVKIDGSDLLTPVVTTSEVKSTERVTVMIKDHYAIVTGNLTTPAASTDTTNGLKSDMDNISGKIANFEIVIADKVSTNELEAKLAVIDKALIGKASIGELEAVKATIKDLNVDSINAQIATINKALIGKAEITDLEAVKGNISSLTSTVANIETVIGGNLTMDNIQSLVLTASKVTVDNAFIKDAMIDRVSAGKLTAGVVNTNNVNLESEDGSMSIIGSLQQFKDSSGNVRIQLGKDTTGDFTFALYGADGQGQLINQNGITSSAIADGLIVNDMISSNSPISGNKLDINSVVTEINGSTTTINSNKIYLDDKKQTLDIAFNNMSTTVGNLESLDGEVGNLIEKVNTNTTALTISQGKIESLISNTTITNEEGVPVQLKDDYASFKLTVEGINSKVGSLETNYAKTLKSTRSEYYVSLSGISLVGGSWSEGSPNWSEGKFIWQRLVYVYSDNSEIVGDPACIQGAKGAPGTDGMNGSDGVSITSVINKYLATNTSTGVTTSTSGWTETIQTTSSAKKYLWNYETITFSNGLSKSTSPCIIGTYGDKGDTGSSGQNGSNGQDGKGIKTIKEYYQISSSNTTAPTTWSETVLNTTTTNKYLWNYEVITYTDNTTTSTPKKVIGTHGTTGATGSVGQSVTGVIPQFMAHTSGTSAPTSGTWLDSCPAYTAGKYLWIRNKVSFVNPTSTSYTTPYYDPSWDAKATADDAKTTVTSKVAEFTQKIGLFESKLSETESVVSQLGSTVSNQGSSITQLTKSLELKAETTYVNTQIDTVNKSVDTKISAAKADIKITTDSITQSVSKTESTLTEKINNIEVGGRNLLHGTRDMKGSSNLISETYKGFKVAQVILGSSSPSYKDAFTQRTLDNVDETEYVVSFYAKSSSPTNIRCYYYNPNTTISAESSTGQKSTAIDGLCYVSITTEWVRYWVKWKQTSPSPSNKKYVIIGRIANNSDVSICGVKFEAGNVPTDWTPAPEDVDGNITSLQTRMSSAESKITPDAIKNVVSNSFYDKNQTDNKYVDQSVYTQKVDEFEWKFETNGRDNMMPNGNPTVDNFDGWYTEGENAFIYIWNPNQKYVGLASRNTTWETFAYSPLLKVEPGKTYSVSFYVQKEYNVKSTEVYCIGSRDLNYAYDWTPSLTGTIKDNDKHEYKINLKIPDNINYIRFRIDHDMCMDVNGGFVVWFGEFMVIDGADYFPQNWYASSYDLFNNISSITKDGIKVRMQNGEGTQGYSLVDYEGISIYDANNKRKAWFGDSDTAFIDTITCNTIYNRQLVKWNDGRPSNYHIAPNATGDGSGRDENNLSNSINHTLAWIRDKYGVYSYKQDINIHVNRGTYSEDIVISGWIGSGMIQVVFDNHAVWYGNHTFEENTMPIYFRGRRWNEGQWINEGCTFIKRGGLDRLFTVRASISVELCDIRAVNEGWGGSGGNWSGYGNIFMFAFKGSKVYVNGCDYVGFYWGFLVHNNTMVTAFNNRGHVFQPGQILNGSRMIYSEAVPHAFGGFECGQGSKVDSINPWGHNSAFQPRELGTAPPPEPPPPTQSWKWFEQSFATYNLRTVPEGSGSTTSGRNGEWGQGKWGSYKPHRGYADLGNDPSNWCSGGRNFTARMTLRRSNTSHGYAGEVPVPKFKLSDGSFWSCGLGFSRGQTRTFDLHGDLGYQIASGNFKTLEMWAGSSTNDYSFFDWCEIKMVCEKYV